ncbi:hypothetical protein KKC60_04450 [Patescibacteria group bacterium]|nr:hypothetical protein [Patescibacteria group bacterium]
MSKNSKKTCQNVVKFFLELATEGTPKTSLTETEISHFGNCSSCRSLFESNFEAIMAQLEINLKKNPEPLSESLKQKLEAHIRALMGDNQEDESESSNQVFT